MAPPSVQMSTIPPYRGGEPLRSMNSLNNIMAAAAIPKLKPITKSNTTNAKTKLQTHRRSRTGCYTCRLRRKKCDEATPSCTACRHLGLQCLYKRPTWWNNIDDRRSQKENIKMITKRKKLLDRPLMAREGAPVHAKPISRPAHVVNCASPPGLTYSTTTTCTEQYSRNRSSSIESLPYEINRVASNANNLPGPFLLQPEVHGEFPDNHMQSDLMLHGFNGQPYDDDIPMLHESHLSTFSYLSPPLSDGVADTFHSVDKQDWCEGPTLPSKPQLQIAHDPVLSDDPVSLTTMAAAPSIVATEPLEFTCKPEISLAVELSKEDQQLLNHFLEVVLPTVFPILQLNNYGFVNMEVVLPALQHSRPYLHCSLAVAAQSLKANLEPAQATSEQAQKLDNDIMRHRSDAIASLCSALSSDRHDYVLEAVLALITLPRGVGKPDNLVDVAWHHHFQAAVSLITKNCPQSQFSSIQPTAPAVCGIETDSSDTMMCCNPPVAIDTASFDSTTVPLLPQTVPFSTSLMAWIDIMGATMQRRAPQFADLYRDMAMAGGAGIGLREVMGCDDLVMYLISEIACLDALKRSGRLDDMTLCQQIAGLGEHINATEFPTAATILKPALDATTGSLDAPQLTLNITAAFRLAARIYLVSLVPGFDPTQAACVGLVEKLAHALSLMPLGIPACDTAVAWVWVVGGSVATAGSSLRTLFDQHMAALRTASSHVGGVLAKVEMVLRATWVSTDAGVFVDWRDVMTTQGWDWLLM